MSSSFYHSTPKSQWFRLGSRPLLCLLFFTLGCTLSLCLLGSMDCPSAKVDRIVSTDKADISNIGDKVETKKLVILIMSAPDNVTKRHALRLTWLSLVNHDSVKYYFVIGSKNIVGNNENVLLTEEGHYSDLLILPDVEEGYDLLSNKLLASFSWINKNADFEFLLKVDDDSYVDVRQLLIELSRKTDTKNLYWGYFNGHAQVKQKGKWAEKNWNLCDHYLPYARGGGYVLSRRLVHYLAENANLLSVYKNEDVSVGAWLAPLNVTRLHDHRFDTEWASRGCSNQHLITHPQEVSEMYKIHESLSNKGFMCQHESVKRAAYNYDWTVLPSQCCKVPVV